MKATFRYSVIRINYETDKIIELKTPTKREFYSSFACRPFNTIKSVFISCKLGGIYVKDPEKKYSRNVIRDDNDHTKWDVQKASSEYREGDEPEKEIFICKDGKEFINIFEKHLINELEKKEEAERQKKYPYSPPPPDFDDEQGAGLMM